MTLTYNFPMKTFADSINNPKNQPSKNNVLSKLNRFSRVPIYKIQQFVVGWKTQNAEHKIFRGLRGLAPVVAFHSPRSP